MKKVLVGLVCVLLSFSFNISFADSLSKAEIDSVVDAAKNEAVAKAEADAVRRAATCGTWNWGCADDWDIVVSVPAIKLKQGEKAKMFEGISAGVQLNNLFGKTDGSLASGFTITPALMLATSETIDVGGNKSSDYVLSVALSIGVAKVGGASFSIGWGHDVMSSQPGAVFNATKKDSILFNVGTAIR